MDLDRIYVAFTKSGKEVLLYKCDDMNFLDLVNNDYYSKSDIDSETLVKYCISNVDYNSKKRVVKHYLLDRKRRLKLSKLIIGDIRVQRFGGIFDYKIIKNKVFKLVVHDGKVRAKDLITGRIYSIGLDNTNNSIPTELLKKSSIISAKEYLGYNNEKYDIKRKILERNYKKTKGE